jgi:hypothetical protein
VKAASWLGVAACALALACAGPGAEEAKPGVLVAESVSVTATVEAVDHGQRTALLRRPDGTLVALRLGPEVRNLDQVRKGDRVVATYVDSVAIFVADDADQEPGVTAGTKVELAPRGAKPGVVATNLVEIRARVERVDLRKRTVTLVGAAGVIGTFRVDPSVRRLEQVEPGDDVVARITEATAIEVKAP